MHKNKQFSYVFLTINPKAKCRNTFEQTLEELLLDNPNMQYAWIIHEADEDILNEHVHLVIYSKGKAKRFTTWKSLFDGADIEETTQARYKRTLQYLIHKNDETKKQYKISDITTNINTIDLEDILNGSGYDYQLFNANLIYDYIEEFKELGELASVESFVRRFGLEAIKGYYFIIKDIVKDYKENFYKDFKKTIRRKDPVTLLWESLEKDYKMDYNIALQMGLVKSTVDFEEFLNTEYRDFIDAVNKGYYDKELKKFENL